MACEPPPALPEPALERVGQLVIDEGDDIDEFILDLLEVEVDPSGEYLYGVGQGGVISYRLTGGDPEFLHRFALHDTVTRFHHLELMGDLAIATNREFGIWVVDIGEPTRLVERARIQARGYAAPAVLDPYVYIAHLDGALEVWDLSDPDAPERVGAADGLDSPWEVVIQDGRAYVADNALGLVIYDLSSPTEPELLSVTPVVGAALDVAVEDDVAYVAAGADGIQAFDVSEPEAPVALWERAFAGSVVSVSVHGGLVWGVDYEGAVVVDVSAPEAPLPLGVYPTDEWAMAVEAVEDGAIVGNWGNVDVVRVRRDVLAPSAEPSPGEVYFADGQGSRTVELYNFGGADLNLLGGSYDRDLLSVRADRTVIPPFGKAILEIAYLGDDAEYNSTLCLVTDDPASPIKEVVVGTTSANGATLAVGQEAIDFVLYDVDGNAWRLSEQHGKPVFLLFYASW